MEKGSMRLEANISLSPDGSLPDYKVEIKNINSFKFLEKAINAELLRQKELLEKGEKISQETRGYDEVKQTTFLQRVKEESNDYRYFPEPDLPAISFSDAQIENVKSGLPELPSAKRERFQSQFGLSKDFIDILVSEKARADYFEEAVRLGQGGPLSSKTIADLMVNKKLDGQFPEPAGLVKRIVEIGNVQYASNDDVENAVKSVLMENEKAVSDYKSGNGNVVGFLIGMVQKKLKGKGKTQTVREELLKELQK
jgi:aspartyl-tRNA(Asn)/glutamyl-tRNA(Gln) amidotransferase subunit B